MVYSERMRISHFRTKKFLFIKGNVRDVVVLKTWIMLGVIRKSVWKVTPIMDVKETFA